MAVADTAELVVRLNLKDGLSRGLLTVDKRLSSLSQRTVDFNRAGQQIGTGIQNGAKIAAVGLVALTSQVAVGLRSLVELEKATAQTEAVIKSTGGTAGVTADQIRALSEQYESLNATIGDETIQAGANVLLTFTQVRKEAFEPALEAALDLSTALGQDLQSSVIQIGKALNDPIRGITALRRVGVSFTKQQEDQIKALVEANDLYGAQRIVLAELNKEFGGSFLAQGNTTAGKVAKFQDAIEDLQRSLATALLPAVSNIADELSAFFADPAVIRGAEELGVEIGKLFSKDNIRAGIDALKGVFETARTVAPTVAAAARTMGQVVTTAVRAFQSLPPEIQNLAIAGFAVNKLTGGLVTNIGGGLIGAVLRQLKSAVVTVHGGVVNVSGPTVPGGGVPPAAGGGGGGIGGAARAATKAATVVLAPAAVLELGSVIAGANRESANRIVGSNGNIVRSVSDVSQRIQVVRDSIAQLEQRAASGDAVAARQLASQREVLARLLGATDGTTTAVENMRTRIDSSINSTGQDTKTGIAGLGALTGALLGQQLSSTISTAFATQGVVRGSSQQNAATISAAIARNRPVVTTIVNVTATHVTKSTTIQKRYGNGGGSRNQDSNGSGTLGNGGV